MKSALIVGITAIAIISSCSNPSAGTSSSEAPDGQKKILFVCTSVAEVNGNANGTFLSEIAVPFILLQEADYHIDVVSPKGGPIPTYYKFDTTEVISRALRSDYYQSQIGNSLQSDQVDPQSYAAVIIPGGYGQFWDIHTDSPINKMVAEIYENEGVVATIGHGSAALVNIDLANGQPLVKGKTLTCFPTWFEQEVMFEADYGKLLPFDMEVELARKGALLKKVDKETRSNSQIIDTEHRLITASLAATGGEFVAEELMKMLSN